MKPLDPLDSVLKSWRPEVPADEGFHQAVWSRIASQTDAGEAVPRRDFGLRSAAMAAAAAVVFGFSLGFLIPGEASNKDLDTYFERINPLTANR